MVTSVHVQIKGISPLLMHAFPMIEIPGLDKKTPAEQAEHAAYRDPITGFLYVPSTAVQRALVGAAAYSKGKGRSSLQKPAAACFIVSPDRLTLNTAEYVIDSRRVVMPATRGAIIRHRPRVDTWSVEFDLDYDNVLLRETEVRTIVDDAGSRVGLLDFRPERKGPFGRFMVTQWQPTHIA